MGVKDNEQCDQCNEGTIEFKISSNTNSCTICLKTKVKS